MQSSLLEGLQGIAWVGGSLGHLVVGGAGMFPPPFGDEDEEVSEYTSATARPMTMSASKQIANTSKNRW